MGHPTYRQHVLGSLLEGQEWDKSECWLGVVWMLWMPYADETTEVLECAMTALFRTLRGGWGDRAQGSTSMCFVCARGISTDLQTGTRDSTAGFTADLHSVTAGRSPVSTCVYIVFIDRLYPPMTELKSPPVHSRPPLCRYPEAERSGRHCHTMFCNLPAVWVSVSSKFHIPC